MSQPLRDRGGDQPGAFRKVLTLGRFAAVAGACAEQIEAMLRVVVPALTGSERISA